MLDSNYYVLIQNYTQCSFTLSVLKTHARQLR